MNDELAPFLQNARAGDVEAEYAVSEIYGRYGQSSARLEWLSRAAQAGSRPAAMQLGALYTVSNPNEALKWYDMAANEGDANGASAAASIRQRQQEVALAQAQERERVAKAQRDAQLQKQAQEEAARQQSEAALQQARQAAANLPNPQQALSAFNYLKQQMTISTSVLGESEPGLASVQMVEGSLCRLRCGFHLATFLTKGGVQDSEIEFNLSDINTETIESTKDGIGRAIISFGTTDGSTRFMRRDRDMDMKQNVLSDWEKWESVDKGFCRAKPDQSSLDRVMHALAYLADSCGAKKSPF